MKRYTTIIKEYCNDFEHEIVGKLTRACEYEITKSDRCYVDDSLKRDEDVLKCAINNGLKIDLIDDEELREYIESYADFLLWGE